MQHKSFFSSMHWVLIPDLELIIEYGTFPQGPVFKLSPPLERVWGGGDLTHNGQ